MKFKKLLAVGLSLGVAVGAFGCSKKEPAPTPEPEKTVTDQNSYVGSEYAKVYSGLYDTNVVPLTGYTMYATMDDINTYYTDNEYPGNEKYLGEVKAAYKDSRDKIQAFVDGLKKDAKTDDKDLVAANDKLIAEGEKAIQDIDAKLKRLEGATAEDLKKSQNDFISFVNNTDNGVKNDFNNMITEMNKMLGVQPSVKTTK
ncbi:MAG: hypothetical protein ACRDD7_14775 [Peptostreptococcaceae bacterium]